MAITIGYATDEEYISYAAARGESVSASATLDLTKSLDWLELQPFLGEKTDEAQELEFPRDGETEVPAKIKTVQMVCAMIYHAGGNPMAAIGPRVIRRKVGDIEREFSDKGNQTTLYPQLSALLRPFLSPLNTGINVKVTKI